MHDEARPRLLSTLADSVVLFADALFLAFVAALPAADALAAAPAAHQAFAAVLAVVVNVRVAAPAIWILSAAPFVVVAVVARTVAVLVDLAEAALVHWAGS